MKSEVARPQLAAVEQLFEVNYQLLHDLVLSGSVHLYAADAERIMQALANRLTEYSGPVQDEPFLNWAKSIVITAADRLERFCGMHKKCRNSVLSGIWSVLGKSLDLKDHTEIRVVIEWIESNVWVWVLEHLDDLLQPGAAALSTRLYAQGKYHALTWRKNRLRDRERFDDAPVEGFGVVSSDAVDVAGRVISEQHRYFDPGCHEDDLEEEVRDKPGKYAPVPMPSDSMIAMKSGRPLLLCPTCRALQAISPGPAKQKAHVVLTCGHERPKLLPPLITVGE
jgi:hypothetical protein